MVGSRSCDPGRPTLGVGGTTQTAVAQWDIRKTQACCFCCSLPTLPRTISPEMPLCHAACPGAGWQMDWNFYKLWTEINLFFFNFKCLVFWEIRKVIKIPCYSNKVTAFLFLKVAAHLWRFLVKKKILKSKNQPFACPKNSFHNFAK